MRRLTAFVLFMSLAGVLPAGAQQPTETASPKSARKKAASNTDAVLTQLKALQQTLDSQQQQLQQLSDQVKQRDERIQQLEQKLDASQAAATQADSKAESAASKASEQDQAVAALKSDVADMKANSTNSALSLQETQKALQEINSPLAIHYKGITITPGGFLEAATVWRQHALASDIATPFNAIPMPGAPQDRLSEFFGSGRHSRISGLVEGKLNMAKLTGYVEADFLSAGITSNNNQSNSYTLRQRQLWGQAALNNGVTITTGQMWSLVTETKKGLDNRSEAPPMTVDPNYNVGFSFTRQYGFRVTKNFANKFWLGFSAENPQAIFAGSGQANFVLGSAGTGGGAYNPTANYTFNSAPDFVFKAAAEPGFGHFEAFGVVRRFRDRVYPNATAPVPSTAGAFNSAITAAGAGANVRFSLFKKHLDLGAHFLGGDGMGRYGAAALPDVTVNPDGTLVALRSYQGLGTIEYHGTKLDVFLNGGSEYVGRHSALLGTKYYGYGLINANNTGCTAETVPASGGFSPGSLSNCSANTRALVEGSMGFFYRFYKGPKGTISWGPQYSYLVRTTWSGNDSGAVIGNSSLGQPRGIENMVLTQFRYVLP